MRHDGRAITEEDARATYLACIPYSKSQRIAGTWAGDFEYDPFFDGEKVTFERAFSQHSPFTTLSPDPELARNSAGVRQKTLKYIEFDGRRPLCKVPNSPPVFIVEHVVSEQIIETRPSPWFEEPTR
jgi:hypothetical protein